MGADSSLPSAPSWGEVVLVCKDCRKRSSGPKGLKTKQVMQEAKQVLRDVKPRPRVLTTGCLGICPKSAMAVARVGGPGGPRTAGVESLAQVASLLPRMAFPGSDPR